MTIRLGHVALFAHDRERLSAFYESLFGMQRKGKNEPRGESLLAFDSTTSHHDLSIVSNPHNVTLTFLVESLEELRALWEKVRERGIFIRGPFLQEGGICFAFPDVEGNKVEIKWMHQKDFDSYGKIDFESQSDEKIKRYIEELANKGNEKSAK